MSLKIEAFEPALWARSGHSQTIWGHLIPSKAKLSGGQKFEVKLPDGDRLVGTHYEGTSSQVLHVFHGLAGTANADYMLRTARVALARGHSVTLVNHRGCGEGVGLASRPYHSGRGDDVSSVIEWARKQWPKKRQLALGYSLGGNSLLNLLTGLRGTEQPDAAISVNAPIDLQAVATCIGQGFNRVYDYRFVKMLKQDIADKQARGLLDRDLKLPPFLSLKRFDELYTGPVGGFGTGASYYEQCSTHRHLDKIRVPTVILTAEDDPFVPYASYRDAKVSSTVTMHAEKHGGHMGYLSRRPTPLGTRRWLDYAVDEALKVLGA